MELVNSPMICVRVITAALLILTELVLPSTLRAGASAPPANPIVRVESSLVLVPVSATDIHGGFVAGLTAADFELREDGQRQAISSALIEDGPMSLCIVLDVSHSMERALPYARDAVRKLLAHTSIADEFLLVSVQNEPAVSMNWTSDANAILSVTDHAVTNGETALLDGVMLAMTNLRHARHRKRAVVIISDGADNNSRYTRTEVLRFVREANAVVYAIHMTDWSAESWDTKQALNDFAVNSGGRYFEARRAADFSRIAQSLDAGRFYLIAYTPKQAHPDGKYRRIALRMRYTDNRRPTHLSWKRGYYMPYR
jgi:Ca-activated chloride channel homolog